KRTVGLTGLHIVTKTPTHPQGIWSTFEHIDNVPAPQAGRPFTFNNGDDTPMPKATRLHVSILPAVRHRSPTMSNGSRKSMTWGIFQPQGRTTDTGRCSPSNIPIRPGRIISS